MVAPFFPGRAQSSPVISVPLFGTNDPKQFIVGGGCRDYAGRDRFGQAVIDGAAGPGSGERIDPFAGRSIPAKE
ncbi:MAG: hypothetical protein ACLTZY_11040 [Alistipes indistinctus]